MIPDRDEAEFYADLARILAPLLTDGGDRDDE